MNVRNKEQHIREVLEVGNSLNEQVSRAARDKHQQKMEAMYKKREEQLNQIVEKVQEHVRICSGNTTSFLVLKYML